MITVIIPALNEERSIQQTIGLVKNCLYNAGFEFEIIVVDDGSTDSTQEKARASQVTVLRHPENAGYGRSLKAGIRAAKHNIIIIIDADLTYPAEAIPLLIKDLENGFDMAVGARTGHYYSGSVFKGPLRMLLKSLVEFTVGRKVPDVNSGLRAFRRSTILPYLGHLCDTFSFTTSLTLAYMLTGKFVSYRNIPYHQRVGSTKVRLLGDSLRTLQYIVQAITFYNPLKIFLLLCFCCAFIAICSLVAALLTGAQAATYIAAGSIIAAIIVFAVGLVADLLRQLLVNPRLSYSAGLSLQSDSEARRKDVAQSISSIAAEAESEKSLIG